MYIGFVNGGFKITWCEYLWVAISPPRKFRNMKCSRSDSRPILGLLRAIDRYTVTERFITWVYIGFVNRGFEILWCENVWVATFSCGGFGGPPPRKCRNMKCSKSDSRPIIGLLRAIDRYTVTERL